MSAWRAGAAGEDVGEKVRVIVLIEKNLDRHDVKYILSKAPYNFIPGGGRAVKQSVRCNHQPVAAVIERQQRCQLFSCGDLPQARGAVGTRRSQHTAVWIEGHPRNHPRVSCQGS